MNTRQKAISAFLVILTFVAAVIALQGDAKPTTVASSSKTSPKTINGSEVSMSCNLSAVATSLTTNEGFTAAQFTVGKDNFNLELPGAKSAGSGSFSSTPLVNESVLLSFLNGTGSSSTAALAQFEQESGATQTQLKDPRNWIGIQYLVPVTWPGNTDFYVDRGVVSSGALSSPAGDIEWLFVDPSNCLTGNGGSPHMAITRGGCGNVERQLPKPVLAPPTPCPQCVSPATIGTVLCYQCGNGGNTGSTTGAPPVAPPLPPVSTPPSGTTTGGGTTSTAPPPSNVPVDSGQGGNNGGMPLPPA